MKENNKWSLLFIYTVFKVLGLSMMVSSTVFLIVTADILLQVTKTRPNDRDAQRKFQECQKVVKMIMFQKAIAVEENTKTVAQSIDLRSMGMCYVCVCVCK